MKLIKVKAFVNSRKDRVIKMNENLFQVFVKEKAENNLANQKILELLSDFFKIEIKKLIIARGQKNKNKWIQVFD